MAHTKGKWVTSEGNLVIWSQERICLICLIAPTKLTEEDQANGKLIAAAPDLLEALKEIYNILDVAKQQPEPVRNWQIKAKEAIAKAT